MPAPAHAPTPAPVHQPAPTPASGRSPLSAPVQPVQEERTMVTRSRFGDEMSVHEERTVIGQIPAEALEFERMFAQRTQPPPPDAPSAPAIAAPAVAAVANTGPLPSFV